MGIPVFVGAALIFFTVCLVLGFLGFSWGREPLEKRFWIGCAVGAGGFGVAMLLVVAFHHYVIQAA